MTAEKPYKHNVPGPFYVGDGCCLRCDIPFVIAPGMFEYNNEDSHCFVKKQPENEKETGQMIRAVISSEVECIRYSGRDQEVLRRLAEAGSANLADILVVGIKPILRDHVTFDAVNAVDKLLLNRDLATDFQDYLRSVESVRGTRHKFTKVLSNGEKTSFSFSWFENNFHHIEFHFLGLPECRWLVVSDATFSVYDWLVDDGRFFNQRWYTNQQWNTKKEWQDTPW